MREPLAPTRWRRAAALGLTLAALSACASDPDTSGARWRRSHPGTGRSLIRTVAWPGTTVRRIEADAHGFRTVLRFSGDDSDMGAFVQVEPADADPCKAVPYFISDLPPYHPDPKTYGHTAFTDRACKPAGRNAWDLSDYEHNGSGYASYAERRDGVLLILTTTDTWTDPDFTTIAATLHPLNDRQLGSLLRPELVRWIFSLPRGQAQPDTI